jgi:hypothetical protein
MYLGCRKALKTGAQLVASAHEQGAANLLTTFCKESLRSGGYN